MGLSPPPWLTVNEIVHFCRGRFSSCPKRDRYQTLNIHVKISFQFWISHKGDAGCFTPQMLKLPSGDKYSYKGGIYLSEMSIPVRKAEHCFGSESMIFSLICKDAQTTTYFPLLPVIKHSRWWKKVAWGGLPTLSINAGWLHDETLCLLHPFEWLYGWAAQARHEPAWFSTRFHHALSP